MGEDWCDGGAICDTVRSVDDDYIIGLETFVDFQFVAEVSADFDVAIVYFAVFNHCCIQPIVFSDCRVARYYFRRILIVVYEPYVGIRAGF
jgi:hypothetical protein